MIAGVFVYIWVFINVVPDYQTVTRAASSAIYNAQAFGSYAFLLLTVVLCLGPLARLDERFLPLVSNRRHFGVL
ncbi:MAG: hypothetical protein CMM46_15255 [Rhodospirillaceae bacterium]|nr:hypothetical protein [Rhodospirillaceae bacterium]